jgi:phospholipid/cholesterol/gamma-HCH transport system ATP-binding protein
MVAADPLIDMQQLNVRFGRQQVLRDLTLTVPRGQTLAVIGESGCGKTVLLKTIIGLVPPTSGTAAFDGRQLDELSDQELAQQRTRFGFVFQNAALFDSMTIAENILFPLKQHQPGHDAEHVRAMMGLLTEVGLPKTVLTKRPAELSGGMRKRVGLARALIMRPEAVLYDEPTTGLDPIMSDVINELMIRTRDRYEVTSVIVTHDMTTARKVADRVVMLYPLNRLEPDESQVLFDGPPDRLDAAVLTTIYGEEDWTAATENDDDESADIVKLPVAV